MDGLIAADLFQTEAFIANQWIAAEDGGTFSVLNPATGETIAQVADCGPTEAERAVKAAHEAFQSWKCTTAAERSDLLLAWRNLLVENAQDLALILTREMGKPLGEARGEILYGASYLTWYAEEAKRIYGETIPSQSADARTLVIRQPVGVCGAITPWNFPNAMLMRKAAAALAAGCTMVAKPAEDTPLSALALGLLAERAGLPAGVFNVVPTADPASVGRVLTTHPMVRKVSFTGSTEVGRILLEQCALGVKKASMELGGNAPFIVFEDADLDAAADGAITSKFRNAGQTCVCTNRILVQAGVREAFAEKLATRMAALEVAPGEREGAVVGPLINADALAKVERLVADARGQGAEVRLGGERADAGDLFYQPTLVDGVTPDMALFRTEIFGPVAGLTTFHTEAEAIRLANDTDYGLAAYFYSQDLGRAWRVGEALEFGMVGINTGLLSSASAPFGGVKQSGMGREGSRHGLNDYLELKYMLMGGLGA